jgi:hypothetical protein
MKINEAQLAKIISEVINEAVKEKMTDYLGSGQYQYQGTGSPESEERAKKIRDKQKNYNEYNLDSLFTFPGKPGMNNDSDYLVARKTYGGKHAKSGQLYDFIGPLIDKMNKLDKSSEGYKILKDLFNRFCDAYRQWADEHAKAAEEE